GRSFTSGPRCYCAGVGRWRGATQRAQVWAVKALLRGAGLGRLSRSLGSEAGWAQVLAALGEYSELRSHVAQHRALWRCAGEQVATPDGALAQQPRAWFPDPL